jgi:ankyrin repeat protein
MPGKRKHAELAAEVDLRPDTLHIVERWHRGARAMACETARECVERYRSLRTVPPRLTLAHVAAACGRMDVLALCSSSALLVLDHMGYTPVDIAVAACAEEQVDELRELLAAARGCSRPRLLTAAVHRDSEAILGTVLATLPSLQDRESLLGAVESAVLYDLAAPVRHLVANYPWILRHTDAQGQTLPHRASLYGSDRVMELLVRIPELGPCFAKPDRSGDLPLELAQTDASAARSIMAMGRVPELRGALAAAPRPPSLALAQRGMAGALRALHSQGSEQITATLTDEFGGRSVAQIAAEQGDEKIVRLLTTSGLVAPLRRASFLRIVCARGCTEILELLLCTGRGVSRAVREYPVLATMARTSHTEAFEWAWRRLGARATLRTDGHGATALHAAVQAGRHQITTFTMRSSSQEQREALLGPDLHGHTPVYYAIDRCLQVRGMRGGGGARRFYELQCLLAMLTADDSALVERACQRHGAPTPFEHAVYAYCASFESEWAVIVELCCEAGLVSGLHAHALRTFGPLRFAVAFEMLPPESVADLPTAVKLQIFAGRCQGVLPRAPLRICAHSKAPAAAISQLAELQAVPSGLLDVLYTDHAAHGDGLRREWVTAVVYELVHGGELFRLVADGTRVHPNPQMPETPENVRQYRCFGRLCAASLAHGEPLGVPLTVACVKAMLPWNYDESPDDAEELDPALHRSRCTWVRDADRAEWEAADLDLRFADEATGAELVPDGARRAVTYDNKASYASLLALHAAYTSVRWQCQAIRDGVAAAGQDLLDDLCRTCTAAELARHLCGAPPSAEAILSAAHLDGGLDRGTACVRLLADYLHERPERVPWLLRFVTGSERLPLGGLDHAAGYNGAVAPLRICPVDTARATVPMASTCTNTLFLPRYDTAAALRRGMEVARTAEVVFDEQAIGDVYS